MDEYVANILFTDGVWRPVYEHADGGQYVTNADGDKVYGVWFIPPDEPTPTVIVNMQARPLSGGFPYPRFTVPWQCRATVREGTLHNGAWAPTVSIRPPPAVHSSPTSRGDGSYRIALP